MTTRFSKQKLDKAKGGIVSGLSSKRRSKMSDISKEDPVVTPPLAHSPAKRPASPTSSLEVIASAGKEVRKKKKIGGKSFLPTFWDDAGAVTLKAYKALFVDDLSPLMAKSSGEVMSSHIQKLVQALRESLFISGKLLDLERKVASSKPVVKSLSAENETLKNKVAILTIEAKNDKECVAVLENSLQVEKDFCKLKDKQIGDLELKLQKVRATAVKEFKDSDEYFDELCGYYVEGFDLLRKWMAKHHLDLDLSGLVMDDVEKELMSDHPSEAMVENVTEEATNIAEVMEKAAIAIPADPIPDEQ
ncbi:hypothetical protein SO802_009678 [Lithocarpus litseifolius]|uniref:Uncharacterized protein n=1 Tax=Lithocarpus litseifolius TaxID=425828 RepID=A0AAW2DGE5_9ROSI